MASRGLGSLTLDLIAKIGGFVGPLSQADRELDKRSRAMQRRANDMQKAVTGSFKTMAAGVAGFVAGFVSVQAVFTGIKSAIDQADKLNDFNKRLGVSAEALSGWGYAAKQTGTDIDALGVGLKKLSRTMTDALDPKSQQAGFFDALGVDVIDPVTKKLRDLEDVLPEIADGFKALNNETLELSLSQELFGKSGEQLLEFLNLGSTGLDEMRQRARELGIELSQDTLSAADQFNDTVTDLQAAAQGFFTQLASELLPELTRFTEKLIELVRDGDAASDTARGLSNGMEAISAAASFAYSRLDGLGKIIEGLTQGFVDLNNAATRLFAGDFKTAANIFKNSTADALIGEGAVQFVTGRTLPKDAGGLFGNVRTGSNSLQGRELQLAEARMKRQKEAEDRLLGLLSGDSDAKAKKPKREGKSDAEKEAERLEEAYKNLNASLTEQAALFGKTGEAAKVRYDIEFGSLQGLTKAQKDELIVRAEKIDTLREEAELEERLDALHDKRAEATKSLLDDLAFESELLGKTADEQELLNNLRWLGVEASEADRQKVIAATQAMQERREVINEQTEAMDALRDAGRGFFDDLREGEGIWDSLTNAADRFADTITRMIENKLIEQLFGQQGSAGGGAAGGWISTLFGSLFGGGRAGGGGVSPGMFYRVNENEPEMLSVGGNDYLMMGNQPGIITPRVRTGGSGVTQTLHFHYAAPYDARTEEQKNARLAFETSRAASRNR